MIFLVLFFMSQKYERQTIAIALKIKLVCALYNILNLNIDLNLKKSAFSEENLVKEYHGNMVNLISFIIGKLEIKSS